jgi:BirA family biotin operon repressor/biotin-[acetyl-CoA-carboxylase] ligase
MRTIHRLDSTPSTMLRARELAASGAPHGTAVVANEQTAGQGRLGRSWHSEKGSGLYVSVILRLEHPAPLLTMALGLAVRKAIEQTTGVSTDLRWPNDILIGDLKTAGILVEQHGSAVIAGIGINVSQSSFPPDIADIATSLRLAAGRELDREALLEALLDAVDWSVARSPQDVFAMFTAHSSYVRGKRVVVETPGAEIEGVTDGLDENGFLKVRSADGQVHTIVAGGVRAARP